MLCTDSVDYTNSPFVAQAQAKLSTRTIRWEKHLPVIILLTLLALVVSLHDSSSSRSTADRDNVFDLVCCI